jgi:hypothetical protein
MRIVLGIFSVLLLFTAPLFSQEYVIENSEVNDSLQKTITLIPFQNNYYRSEIDRSLGASENLDFQALRDALRSELDRQLYMILNDEYNVVSFLKNSTQDDQELLEYIYYSTASSYSSLETGEQIDRSILDLGQIKEAPVEEDQRYMKTVIHHPPLLETLSKQLPSDLYLFIGELDILLPQNIEEKEKNRYIYMHFTLYDDLGEIVDSGIISQVINKKKCKHIKDISMDGFAPIAYQLKTRLEALN